MKIFVINLAKDVERRTYIAKQLDDLDLDHEIVPGILGTALSPDDRRRHYDDRKARWRYSRSLLPAEIGCALSHLNVYREMQARGIDRALVLEDDVVLARQVPAVLADCETMLHPERPEVWLLSPAVVQQGAAARKLPRSGKAVLPFRSGVYASSYVLTRAAATALLAELYPVGDVADCWGRLQRYGVVELFAVVPAMTEQNQTRFGSSTTADYTRHVRNDLFTRLAYKARRSRAIVWELFYAPYRRWMRHPAKSSIELRH